MTYALNKTDGTLLVELVDGRVDSDTTDLTFIGKNYQGFGEFLNENFIKLLENFSNSAAPENPIKGQLWFDTSTERLKVYDGAVWRNTDNSSISGTQPLEKIDGDIWIDSKNNQLYFWEGSEWVLVGPQYTSGQGESGFRIETVKDINGQNKNIVKILLGSSLLAIISKERFTPFPAITGFSVLEEGINVSTLFPNFSFNGKVQSAQKLTNLDETEEYSPDDFLLKIGTGDEQVIFDNIKVENNNGIKFGSGNQNQLKAESNIIVTENLQQNIDYEIRVRDNVGDSSRYSALYVDTSERAVGILTNTPAYTLDVNGDMRVSGNLLIQGEAVNFEIQNLRVADFTIELGNPDDSTILGGEDSTTIVSSLDGAGIVIKSPSEDKLWIYDENSIGWLTKENINLDNDNAVYKIGNSTVLSKDTLGSTVKSAPGLTNIGKLTTLEVDNITFDNSTITVVDEPLTIFSIAGDIRINPGFTPVKITNVATPVSPRDVIVDPGLTEDPGDSVVTKDYVEKSLSSQEEIVSIDATGLGTGQALETALVNIIEVLKPASTMPVGKIIKVLATQTESSGTDTIDISGDITQNLIAVDSAGVQNVNVVQSISVDPTNISVTFNITRTVIHLQVVTGGSGKEWTYGSALTNPINPVVL